MGQTISIFGKKFSPKARYDQHFMKDKEVLSLMIREAKIGKKDIVLEIGPGNGALTKILSKKSKKVIAVEIDSDLSKILEKRLTYKNIEIINGDAVNLVNKIHFDKLLSNLPYMILEPLLLKLIEIDFKVAVLTISKKFAERMTSEIDSDKAGRITFIAKSFFYTEKIADVGKESFIPPPKVGSTIIKMVPVDDNFYKNNKTEFLIRELFLQPTKKVKNALMEAHINYEKKYLSGELTKRMAKEKIAGYNLNKEILEKNCRALSSADLRKITNAIYGK